MIATCTKEPRARIWKQPLTEREQQYVEKVYEFLEKMVWIGSPSRHRKNELLMSEAWFVAFKAVVRASKKYDGRCKETTFAYWPIKGAVRQFWQTHKAQLLFENSVRYDLNESVFASHNLTNFILDFKSDPEPAIEQTEHVQKILLRLKSHNKRWHQAIALKYGFACDHYACCPRKTSEVADLVGCSPQLIRARVIAGLGYLRTIASE